MLALANNLGTPRANGIEEIQIFVRETELAYSQPDILATLMTFIQLA